MSVLNLVGMDSLWVFVIGLQDLAEEFKRSPFVRVSSQQDMEQLDDLVKAIQPGSPDSDVSIVKLFIFGLKLSETLHFH